MTLVNIGKYKNINIRNFYKNLEVKHHIFMDTCKFHYNSPRFRAAIKKWYRLKISSELTSFIFFWPSHFYSFHANLYLFYFSFVSFHFSMCSVHTLEVSVIRKLWMRLEYISKCQRNYIIYVICWMLLLLLLCMCVRVCESGSACHDAFYILVE